MVIDVRSINFSKILYTAFQEESQNNKKFKPSILFLAEKSQKIWAVLDWGPLSSSMVDFFHHPNFLNEKIDDHPYKVLTTDVEIKSNDESWQGLLGMVIDTSQTNIYEAESFLLGSKQAMSLAAQYIESEKKYHQFSKIKSVHYKVAKMLKDTDYTNKLETFSKRFILTLNDYITQPGDATIMLKDSFRQVFIPEESTDKQIMNDKEKYIIDELVFLDHFKSIDNKGFTVLHKKDISIEKLFVNQGDYEDFFLIPIYGKDECVGVILSTCKSGNCFIDSMEEMVELTNALGSWFKRLLDHKVIMIEKIRKDLLLKVNRTFYSSMDVNVILHEILQALHEAYPSFTVDLLLSHDWEVGDYLPVQPLDIRDTADNQASKAYLTGEVQVADSIPEKVTILFVPLKGKQGVYGVFKMTLSNSQLFPNSELEFIQGLADTAGNAIENAELYQQSRQHIADLQLINQTSHQLNSNLKLEEAVNFMVKRMREAFSADEVGFVMINQRWFGLDNYMSWNGASFYTKEHKAFITPLLSRIKEDREEIFLGDWSKEVENPPFKSVIGVPMIHDEQIIGSVLVFGKESYAFSFDTFKLCQSLVHHSTLALVNAILHEEMKQLVTTDYLTKLFTREYMDEKVTESMKIDAFGSFVLLDVDHFKQVNDEFGHQTGDDVLIQVAKIIMSNIKQDQDMAVRWGGEELAVYLPRTKIKDAVKVAERIRRKVKEETDPNVSVSCGVSSWTNIDGVPSLTRLFSDADKAMYSAKQSGRNKVIVYSETTNDNNKNDE